MLRYAERLGMISNLSYGDINLNLPEALALWDKNKEDYLREGMAHLPEDANTNVRLALTVAIVSTQAYLSAREELQGRPKEDLPKYAVNSPTPFEWVDIVQRAMSLAAADILEENDP